MKTELLIVVFCLISLHFVHSKKKCPVSCHCIKTVVRCNFISLKKIPSKISPDTTVLDLRFNKLTVLPKGVFSHLPYLHTLLLNNNEIERIENGAFEGLNEVRHLYLYHNRITRIGHKTLKGLSHLETLYLQVNRIRSIHNHAFGHIQYLRRLHLNENQLKHVPYEAFRNLKKIKRLRLDSNVFACDCPMLAMAKYLKQNSYLEIKRSATCMYPRKMRGRKLADLPSEAFHCQEPKIIKEPNSVKVSYGESATFLCRAEGNPDPRIIWIHNESQMKPDKENKYQLFHDGTLKIRNTSDGDEGFYECIAQNSVGLARTRRAQLSYDSSGSEPQFTVTPKDVAVREGNVAKLLCQVTGLPQPLITWYKGSKPIRQSRRFTFLDRNTVLSIYPLLKGDAGRYACYARNRMGEIRSSAELKILESSPPRIVNGPESMKVRPGQMAEFHCSASGYPKPTIVWNFNGSPVPTVKGHYEVSPDGGMLQINDVVYKDRGHYTCQAVNDVGSMSADALLRIERFTDQFQEGIPNIRPPPPQRGVTTTLIRNSVKQATENVDRAINATRKNLFTAGPKSPSELLALFRFPGPQAIELARAREIYEETLYLIGQHIRDGLQVNTSAEETEKVSYESVLSVSHLQMIMELSGCTPGQFKDQCNDMCFHGKYRSYDGQCNNLDRPMEGVSLMPFKRLLPAMYENGFNTPIGWDHDKLYYGYKKPNSRSVSINVVSTSRITPDNDYSAMLMQWGQFIDHDIDFTAAAPARETFTTGAICNRTCENIAPCFNIQMPPEDPRRASRANEYPCIEFERSSAVCGSGQTSVIFKRVTARQQINIITSYMDASQIYGSSEQDALDLRDLFSDHGLLRFDIVSHRQKPYLPFNRDSPMDCQRNVSETHPIRCFMAGDYRANEQLGLTSMHTIWLREHNRIAGKFLQINAHWDGEKIYQESRKIVGAQVQHITYNHWLPKILGPYGMSIIGSYKGYDRHVDPTISNAFATAAFRFGHALINPILVRLDQKYQTVKEGNLPLHQAFFSPERLLSEGGVDPILRGLIGAPSKQIKADQMVNRELTERLFSKAHDVALDLAALNIQRGRDHALPGYLEWRRWCNLSTPDSWEQLAEAIPDTVVRTKLRQLYGHPGNLDLWVAGLSEQLVPGARLGPTFACIIADQFKRLRDGDRFWYENPSVFKAVQLEEIRKTTLAKVICNNGDEIGKVPEDVFIYSTNISTYKTCEQIEEINLNIWQDCCSDSCSQHLVQYEVEKDEKPDDEVVRMKRETNENDIERVEESEIGERLESLENVVLQMKSQLDQLQNQMKKDAEQRYFCFFKGTYKHHGDQWIEDLCTQCKCKQGQIWCTTESCPPVYCESPVKLPFECCPVC